ncbi:MULTISPECIES: helix-turn-helix transcriptional regulator [Paraburkholderia]|uniref:helix-turn-helix transcriptional regulator n=1 Tax=Paraburkholderia dipogonis TaxID=1211383 RepID=UPI0038BC4771
MGERILRRDEVAQRLGVSVPTVVRWYLKGLMPSPVRIGPRSVGWTESTVDAFIASRKEAVFGMQSIA